MRGLRNAIVAASWLAAIFSPPTGASERLTHHEADVTFDAHSRRIEITDRISLDKTGDVAFRLADWLTVERATIDGRPVASRRSGTLWHISFPGAGRREINLKLSGFVPPIPKGAARRSIRGAVASQEGSYLPGSAAWLADTGDPWLTYVLRVKVRGDQRAVATGRIAEEVADGGANRATFAADYPSEPPSLFVGPYRIDERRVGKVRLRTYFHRDIAKYAERYISTAAAYIRQFSALIGDYPYDDFHIISAPLPVGLGFPNLTYIGRRIVPLPFMQGRSLAHEVLHNWWGNGVAISAAGGNWAEGLTTYMADYRLTAKSGPEAAREMRLGWLRDFAALPGADDVPVIAFKSKTHQASQVVGYNKVAHIFHMLHRRLGEDHFNRGMRLYWTKYRFKTAGWTDIQAAFDEATGQDLDWFFRQWLDQRGAPRIELAAATVMRGEKGDILSVSLRQDRPVYRVAIPIEIKTAVTTIREVVELKSAANTFSISLPAPALRVSVDPNFDIFRHLLTGESPPILRDVFLARKVRTIILDADPAFRAAAIALAGRLLDTASVDVGDNQHRTLRPGPTLVIGADTSIAAFARRITSAELPNEVGASAGSSSAWAARTADGHPLIFVRAKNAEALKALLRPLPHYGSQSFIVFEGRRAVRKDIWRMTSNPLSLELAK